MTEVMIVLAVTTALFASAAVMVSGRQNAVGFSQAVNEVKGNMEQVINQTGSGYYADTSGFAGKRCTINNATFDVVFASGATAKGSNGACMVLGQAVQFGIGTGGASLQKYAVHTIVGARTVGPGGRAVQTLPEARARLIANDGTTATSTYPDGRTIKSLSSGLSVAWARYGSTDIGGFALISSVGEYDADRLKSGSQALSLYPLLPNSMGAAYAQATPLRTDEQAFPRVVNQRLRDTTLASFANPASGIQICFDSGGTQQSALITIGGSGRALSVSQQVFGKKQCQP